MIRDEFQEAIRAAYGHDFELTVLDPSIIARTALKILRKELRLSKADRRALNMQIKGHNPYRNERK